MAAANPNQAIKGTGNAPIIKQGHTKNNQHGSDAPSNPKGRSSATDLNIK